VRVPLVVLRPLPRGEQDDEFAQPWRQRAAIAHVVAKRARPRHRLRTAEQRDEGTGNVDRACRLELLDRRLLGRRQLIRGNRRHAVLGDGGRCRREGHCDGGYSYGPAHHALLDQP
jgi:hypothetical protein